MWDPMEAQGDTEVDLRAAPIIGLTQALLGAMMMDKHISVWRQVNNGRRQKRKEEPKMGYNDHVNIVLARVVENIAAATDESIL